MRPRKPGFPRLWLVDLDNTLHDASWKLLPAIGQGMGKALQQGLGIDQATAHRLRTQYWLRYGATLLGVARHHPELCPHQFLRSSHPVSGSLAPMVRAPRGIPRQMQRLRRRGAAVWLLSNAPRHYVLEVLEVLGLAKAFDRVLAVEDMRFHGQFHPKPSALLWQRLIRGAGLPAQDVCLVDDGLENLRGARRAGIRTARVWASPVQRNARLARGAARPRGVDHQVNSWQDLLRQVGR